MSTMWFKTNKRDYSDVFCRIAAFQLTQDNIQTQNLIEKEQWQCYSDTQWLYSDWDAISNFPIIDFSEDEVEKYFTLFNPITIPQIVQQMKCISPYRKNGKIEEFLSLKTMCR